MQCLEKKLNSANNEITEHKEVIQKKDRCIETLEQRMKALDRKYKDELKHKQFNISKLETELQEKCNEIASIRMTVLTTRTSNETLDLQQSKTVNTHSHPSSPIINDLTHCIRTRTHSHSSDSVSSSQDDVDSQSSHVFSHHVPVPPLATSKAHHGKVVPVSYVASSQGKVRHRRGSASHKSLTEVMNRPASGRKLMLGENLEASGNMHRSATQDEEILKIVAQQKESLNLRHGKGMVVPPIHKAGGEVPKKLSPRSATSASFARRIRQQVKDTSSATATRTAGSPEVEVETLAIDTINTDLRKAQEFNS